MCEGCGTALVVCIWDCSCMPSSLLLALLVLQFCCTSAAARQSSMVKAACASNDCTNRMHGAALGLLVPRSNLQLKILHLQSFLFTGRKVFVQHHQRWLQLWVGGQLDWLHARSPAGCCIQAAAGDCWEPQEGSCYSSQAVNCIKAQELQQLLMQHWHYW